MTTGRINQVAFIADNQAQTTPQVVNNKCCTIPKSMKGKVSFVIQIQWPPLLSDHALDTSDQTPLPYHPQGKSNISNVTCRISLFSNVIPPSCLLHSSAKLLSFPTSSPRVAFFPVWVSFTLFQRHPPKLPSLQFG